MATSLTEILSRGLSDPALARALIDRPVTTLAEHHIPLPGLDDADLSRLLATNVPQLHAKLTASAKGFLGDAVDDSLACMACMAACSIAMALLIAGSLLVVPEIDAGSAITAVFMRAGVSSTAKAIAMAKAVQDAFRAGATTISGLTCGANEIGLCPPIKIINDGT